MRTSALHSARLRAKTMRRRFSETTPVIRNRLDEYLRYFNALAADDTPHSHSSIFGYANALTFQRIFLCSTIVRTARRHKFLMLIFEENSRESNSTRFQRLSTTIGRFLRFLDHAARCTPAREIPSSLNSISATTHLPDLSAAHEPHRVLAQTRRARPMHRMNCSFVLALCFAWRVGPLLDCRYSP